MPPISELGFSSESFSLQGVDDADRSGADPIDQASATEALFLRQALVERERQQRLARMEPPDEDEEGNRYCLDCGDLIPEQRLKIVPFAVRCVGCLSIKERFAKQSRQTGGINSAEYAD